MELEQDQRISDVVAREQSRPHNFTRRRVPDPRDAEDNLQDVFYELVEANRLDGAAAGVGTYAVQIAKPFGADVTCVCSTRNVDMVRRDRRRPRH